jgi:NAD(P)-dependent dehydrogenase (short-subunit alcohol dehydrogenase family)
MLVTGGSRGIGAAVARRAARCGWDVAILYRSREADAAAVVADVEAAGRRAVAVRGDVALEADLMRAFEAADGLGPLTSLVANAGITGGVARVESLDAGTVDAVLRVNVWAAFVCAREAVRRMSTRRGGAAARSSRSAPAPRSSATPGCGCTTRRARARSTR